MTGLENPGSVSQLKAWLADMDMPMESLSKRIVREKAAEAEGIVKELLELRLELSKTSIKKYEAMARTVCRDGRVHGMLQFGGAFAHIQMGRTSGAIAKRAQIICPICASPEISWSAATRNSWNCCSGLCRARSLS